MYGFRAGPVAFGRLGRIESVGSSLSPSPLPCAVGFAPLQGRPSPLKGEGKTCGLEFLIPLSLEGRGKG